MISMKEYSRSLALHQRAGNVLAGGVSSEFRKFSQPHPLFYAHAKGSRIWDVDGNEYLDFTLSQGPLILGHSHPYVLKQVTCLSEVGQLFAGQHLAELELAERLQSLIPRAELLRFSLSGSEADHAALRVARAVTGCPNSSGSRGAITAGSTTFPSASPPRMPTRSTTVKPQPPAQDGAAARSVCRRARASSCA